MRRAVVYLISFLLVWVALGCLINVKDGRDYSLQHALVDAVVVHGTFEVGLSDNPRLQPGGDTFVYMGRRLAAKQPGQAVFGAIPYFLLHAVGVTYDAHYDLAAALVAWMGTALWAALAALVLHLLLRRAFSAGRAAAIFAAICWLFGTTVLPYSGVLHHDSIASSLLLMAYACIEMAKRESRQRWEMLLTTLGGTLLGLTLFVSMLPAACVAVVFLYAAVPFRGRRAAGLVFGLPIRMRFSASASTEVSITTLASNSRLN